MTQETPKPKPPRERKVIESPRRPDQRNSQEKTSEGKSDISPDQKMVQTIKNLQGLHSYEIRQLVKDAESLGQHLVNKRLRTNQIRKFLDAVKRLKVELSQDKEEKFSTIKDEVVLLKPKLAYAAARNQSAVKPLADVISAAIDKVYESPDFYRLVQLIESIIAYHKAAGGKDN